MDRFKSYILEKVNFALKNQEQLKEEYHSVVPWNEGYLEALRDILHYIESYEEK